MKKLTFLLLITSMSSYAQEKIVVVINGSDTFFESYKKTSLVICTGNELSFDEAYRLGTSAASELKQGIRTAIKWIDLNKTHKKTFKKEVCRFKAMDKELYKFHGYVDEFSKEITLLFKGKPDGSFEVTIKPYNSSYGYFIEFTNKEMIEKFKDFLDGKSANEEIADIFKN